MTVSESEPVEAPVEASEEVRSLSHATQAVTRSHSQVTVKPRPCIFMSSKVILSSYLGVHCSNLGLGLYP